MNLGPGPVPAWKMALAGSMAGGVAGVLGNPAELIMVRMQADKAKPPESEYWYLVVLSWIGISYSVMTTFSYFSQM